MASNFKVNGSDFSDLFISKSLFDVGGLWSWGNNLNGQLGDDTTIRKSSPVQTISGGTNWKSIFGGSTHTAAIKNDGTLWLWGRNSYGQLGNQLTSNQKSPVQTIEGGNNWKSVSAYNSTIAITTDGRLWTWGRNFYGNLGDNTTANKSYPVQTVAGGSNWKQAACSDHSVAVKTDGTLWLWGRNQYGQLGDETSVNKSSPVQTVAGGTDWKQCAAGAQFTAAIKTNGTLWTWGDNTFATLADGTFNSKSSPVQTIAGGNNWKQVSVNERQAAAIKTNGTLWTWGSNSFGVLGDNTTNQKNSPIQTIAGGTNWKQVSVGGNIMSAIKTDGSLWLWGRNNYGQLGTGNVTDRSSPVQTVSSGYNWTLTSSGGYWCSGIVN